jgi:uncharacterized protein (DUF433 family)
MCDMTLVLEADVLPLRMDQHGIVRVAGTRVTLDTLIAFYRQGYDATRLHEAFPTVPLADIHGIISFYLRHGPEVDAYIAENQRRAAQQRQDFEAEFPPKPLRPELAQKLKAVREGHQRPGPSPRESGTCDNQS